VLEFALPKASEQVDPMALLDELIEAGIRPLSAGPYRDPEPS
jgi:hypothetical protein